MAGVSFPVKRPVGRALVVGTGSGRAQPLSAMQALGYECAEVTDPYAALAELVRRPLVYRAVVVSLTSLYKEELALIATIKRRLPHVQVWVTHIEGRQAALGESLRLGADGLLGEDGLHPTAPPPHAGVAPADAEPAGATKPTASEPPPAHAIHEEHDLPPGEPVLSAEELRALLQEQPLSPPEQE